MKKYLRKEIITPLVTSIFLIVYGIESLKLSPPIIKGVCQESFFPLLIVIIGLPTAISLLVSAILSINKGTMKAVEAGTMKGYIKPALIVLTTVFFVALFQKLGFVLCALIYVFCFQLIYDDKPQKLLKKLIYAILITGFVFVLYYLVFDVRFKIFPWS